MAPNLKIDLGDPSSIRKTLLTWNTRLGELKTESAHLAIEFANLEGQPLNRSEMLELITLQVDRSADWWLRKTSSQLRGAGFSGLASGSLGASMLADEVVFGEPHVTGLTQGAAAWCYLLRDQVLAGFERAIDATPEIVPGPGRVDRLQTLAGLQQRQQELDAEIKALEGWIASIAPLAAVAADTTDSLAARVARIFN